MKALCVDGDSPDYGKAIQIAIPDGYVLILPTDDSAGKLRSEVMYLRMEIEELRQMVEVDE